MTCIAWDGKTLAADKRASDNGLPRTITKIRRVARNGALIGASGSVNRDAELMAWYERGASPEDYPATERDAKECSMLVVIERGRRGILFFNGTPYPAEFEGPHFAMGSGRDFAHTCMHLGMSAAEAVRVACELDLGCGNGIDTLELAREEVCGPVVRKAA
jgi:ATP-dependent protease HslVU (ClpYQ) peptidase subunit